MTSSESPLAAFDESVEHVYLEFCDLNGISRSKQVSAEYFENRWRDGFPVNMLVLVQTPMNLVPEGTGYGGEIGYGDGRLVPNPGTIKQLPWRDGAVRVLCDVEYAGEPATVAPRTVLSSLLDTLDGDLELYVGSELEFHLLDAESNTEPVTDKNREWFSAATERVTPFHDVLSAWGDAYSVPIQSLEHEHGPGQFEVLFDYGRPLAHADTAFDFKRLVKQAATHVGHTASFMAKPFAGESGNGYHLHVSAFRDGENAFAGGDSGELSDIGRQFVGGVMDHAEALTAVHAPTMNAFKRFSSDGFAPDSVAWGYDNRLASFRIPTGTRRIENRIGSADANPYLVIASTIAAGIDGIRREIEPPDPSTGQPSATRERLPRSPEIALRALESDTTLREQMGEQFVRAYVANKRRELDAFRSHVTGWECDRYLDTL